MTTVTGRKASRLERTLAEHPLEVGPEEEHPEHPATPRTWIRFVPVTLADRKMRRGMSG
jgi:hypothetical protein